MRSLVIDLSMLKHLYKKASSYSWKFASSDSSSTKSDASTEGDRMKCGHRRIIHGPQNMQNKMFCFEPLIFQMANSPARVHRKSRRRLQACDRIF